MALYKRLSPRRQEIRLLESLSIDDEGRPTCRLITISLDDTPPFTALSYVWGDPAAQEPILVNGQTFQATANLAAALRHIPRHWAFRFPARDSAAELRVWADAICINQDDLAERAQQVLLMGRVYSEAELVMCWLPGGGGASGGQDSESDDDGDGDEDTIIREAFRTLKLVCWKVRMLRDQVGGNLHDLADDDIRLFDWLAEHPALCTSALVRSYLDNESWRAVREFLRLQYWSRVWIFQEVVLARDPLLINGSGALSLAVVERVAAWFSRLEHCTADQPEYIDYSIWRALTSKNAIPWVHIQSHLWARWRRYNPDVGLGEGGTWRPWIVFFSAVNFRATNPKDHVYGLLGLMGIDFPIDYSDATPVAQVFCDVTNAWLRYWPSAKDDEAFSEFSELFFLKWAGLRRDCPSPVCQRFPSWAPNYPHCKHGSYNDFASFLGGAADIGMFPPETSQKMSCVQGTSLFVTGMIVDTIVEVHSNWLEKDGLVEFISDLQLRDAPMNDDVKCQCTVTSGSNNPLRALFELLLWQSLPERPSNASSSASSSTYYYYLAHAWAFVGHCALWVGNRQDATGTADENKDRLQKLGLRTDSGEAFALSLRDTFLDADDCHHWRDNDHDDDHPPQDQVHVLDNRSYSPSTSTWLQTLLDLKRTKSTGDDGQLTICWTRVQSRVLEQLFHHSFFRTSCGYFGLGPRHTTSVGDFICVLKGSDNTVVLREEDDHFLHVGPSDVHSMQHGEAVELLRNRTSTIQEFELR